VFAEHVDVVVCDGFVGNIMIKSWESLGRASSPTMLQEELQSNPMRATGALLAKGAFDALKDRINPERYGGAPLLGSQRQHPQGPRLLQPPRDQASAIHAASLMLKADLNQRIIDGCRPRQRRCSAARRGLAASLQPDPHSPWPHSLHRHRSATGSYAPPRIAHERRTVPKGRDIRRMDPHPQRHPRAPDSPHQTRRASDMAVKAARRALADAKINAADIDLLIVATATPDTAAARDRLPRAAQARHARLTPTCFDLARRLLGFLYGLGHRLRPCSLTEPLQARPGHRR
jgi:hypothetical protein